jgi:hypothetical protein
VTESIHDDVERALAAYGGSNFSYRTFGSFSIHPRVAVVIEPEVPEAAPEQPVSVPEPDVEVAVYAAAPSTLPPPEAPAPLPSPSRIEPAFGPLPLPPPIPAPAPPQRAWEPALAMAATEAEPAPPPPPPGYAPAHDPYFGPLPGLARGPVPSPLLPGYPAPRPGADPVRPGQPPAPARRGGEMNIFQLAWDSPGAKADAGDRAGARPAAKDGPLPGEEDLFRRI